MSNFTIRPDRHHPDGPIMNHEVYEWQTYPRSSVLAGQSREVIVDCFETLEEAQEAYLQAEFSDSRPSYGHLGVSSCPPSDFDPSYAGERWDDDY